MLVDYRVQTLQAIVAWYHTPFTRGETLCVDTISFNTISSSMHGVYIALHTQ